MWRINFLVVLLLCVFMTKIYGQDTIVTQNPKLDFLNHIDDRKWTLKVPIWVPGFRGNFSYGGLTLLPASEDYTVVDRLNGELGVTFYFIGDITYAPGNWMFNVDGFHTTLASNLGFENVDKVKFLVDLEGTILRGLAGYKVLESSNKDKFFKFQLYPYIGVRYINLDIYSTNTDFLDIRPDWLEPLVGFMAPVQYKRWVFSVKADLGGFGINEHLSWYVNGHASYRFGKLFSMGLGYSVMDFKYSQDIEYKFLDLGIRLGGPVLSVEFNL
jgi:hypothetical protein